MNADYQDRFAVAFIRAEERDCSTTNSIDLTSAERQYAMYVRNG
jgi:hypothetical protein